MGSRTLVGVSLFCLFRRGGSLNFGDSSDAVDGCSGLSGKHVMTSGKHVMTLGFFCFYLKNKNFEFFDIFLTIGPFYHAWPGKQG